VKTIHHAEYLGFFAVQLLIVNEDKQWWRI